MRNKTVRASASNPLGVRSVFSGSQPLCQIVSSGTSEAGCFGTASALVSGFAANYIPIAISQLQDSGSIGFKGRLAVMASLFDQYTIDKLWIEYEPDASAMQAGTFALGYVPDFFVSQTNTYESVQQMTPSLVIPFRTDQKVRMVIPSSERPIYTDQKLVGANSAYAISGMLYGYLGTPATAGTVYGRLRLHYSVSFYRPTENIYGGSLNLTAAEEKLILERRSLERARLVPEAKEAKETVVRPTLRVSEPATSVGSASSSGVSSGTGTALLSDYVMIRRT